MSTPAEERRLARRATVRARRQRQRVYQRARAAMAPEVVVKVPGGGGAPRGRTYAPIGPSRWVWEAAARQQAEAGRD